MEEVRMPHFVASTWKRLGASLIDKMVISTLFLPVIIQNVGVFFGNKIIVIEWRWFFICFTLQFLYRLLFLNLVGATIGKLIFGLKVINIHNFKKPDLMQSFIRVLSDHFSYFVGPAMASIALIRLDRRGLSDLLAETQVVQNIPRPQQPERRWALFVLVFGYFLITGFMSSYRNFQRSEWNAHEIKMYPLAESPDSRP